MLSREFIAESPDVKSRADEDITRRGFLQGAGAVAGAGALGYGAVQQKNRDWESQYSRSTDDQRQTDYEMRRDIRPEPQAEPKKAVTPSIPKYSPAQLEAYIIDYASKHLDSVEELAHFMAQVKTETDNFRSLAEYGGGKERYDGGKDYGGRGFIQLTHKHNYEKYGDMLDLDLVNQPDLLLDPKIAARVSVASWKDYYWPTAKRLSNRFKSLTAAVTKSVNGGLSKLKERKLNTDYYTKYFNENPPASMAKPQKKPTKK